jgi:hypothetical protein
MFMHVWYSRNYLSTLYVEFNNLQQLRKAPILAIDFLAQGRGCFRALRCGRATDFRPIWTSARLNRVQITHYLLILASSQIHKKKETVEKNVFSTRNMAARYFKGRNPAPPLLVKARRCALSGRFETSFHNPLPAGCLDRECTSSSLLWRDRTPILKISSNTLIRALCKLHLKETK